MNKGFKRTRVRLKREIVTMGIPGIDPNRDAGRYVEPAEWNALISDPEVLVIDTSVRDVPTVVEKIPLGGTAALPGDTAVSPDGSLLLVPESGSKEVSLVDLTSGPQKSGDPITFSGRPRQAGFSTDGTKAYVAIEESSGNLLAVIDVDVFGRTFADQTAATVDTVPLGLTVLHDLALAPGVPSARPRPGVPGGLPAGRPRASGALPLRSGPGPGPEGRALRPEHAELGGPLRPLRLRPRGAALGGDDADRAGAVHRGGATPGGPGRGGGAPGGIAGG